MLLKLALIVLLLFPTHWGHARSRGERVRIGAWTMRVDSDRFRDQVRCQLFERNVSYQRRALVFHLPRRADDAVYRIDGGPPMWARSDAMELADLGFTLHSDDLANPSGGLVRIPQPRIAGAHAVSIEPRSDVAPLRFNIDGFAAALDAARKAGCGADAFY